MLNKIESKSVLESRDNSLMEPGKPLVGNTLAEQFNVKDSENFGKKSKNEETKPIESKDVKRINLLDVNESNLLDMPIDAVAFEVPAMLQVALKDKSYIPRWVNFKGHEGSNYSRYLVMGFTNVTADEVDGPLADGLIKDGESITYYDVILMKVPKLRLMQAYKANLIRSMNMVGSSFKTAKSMAESQLRSDVGTANLNMIKQAGQKIDFYIPSEAEIAQQSPDFSNDTL